MPLTEKGSEIMENMKEQYGAEKGEEVFYSSKNKGVITGVDEGAENFQLAGGQSGGLLQINIPDPRAHSGVEDCTEWMKK